MSSCLQFKWRSTFHSWVIGLFAVGAWAVTPSIMRPQYYIIPLYLLVIGPIYDFERIRKGPPNPIKTLSTENLDDYLLPIGLLIALPVLALLYTGVIGYDLYLWLLRVELVAVCLLSVVAVKAYPRHFLVKYRRVRKHDKRWRKVLRGVMVLFFLPMLDCFTGQFLLGDFWEKAAYCALAYLLGIICFRTALMLYGSIVVDKVYPRSSGPERAV